MLQRDKPHSTNQLSGSHCLHHTIDTFRLTEPGHLICHRCNNNHGACSLRLRRILAHMIFTFAPLGADVRPYLLHLVRGEGCNDQVELVVSLCPPLAPPVRTTIGSATHTRDASSPSSSPSSSAKALTVHHTTLLMS